MNLKEEFYPRWKRTPVSCGNHSISEVFTMPRSAPLSPLKKRALKNAWSLAKMNKSMGEMKGIDIFLDTNRERIRSFCINIGCACLFVMRA